jgi:hypothetical protein
VVAVPAWPADSTYRHPTGFTILVPAGWKTDVQQSGVNVGKESAYVSVMVVEGSGSPQGLLEAIVSRVSSQWKQWQPVKRESCNLAGMDGACGWYTGVNPRGNDASLKVAAGGKDGKGYVLFIGAPRQNYADFSRDLDNIERSFSLSGGETQPSSSVKQQLEALDSAYQSGNLTTEEYERRRKALLGR